MVAGVRSLRSPSRLNPAARGRPGVPCAPFRGPSPPSSSLRSLPGRPRSAVKLSPAAGSAQGCRRRAPVGRPRLPFGRCGAVPPSRSSSGPLRPRRFSATLYCVCRYACNLFLPPKAGRSAFPAATLLASAFVRQSRSRCCPMSLAAWPTACYFAALLLRRRSAKSKSFRSDIVG